MALTYELGKIADWDSVCNIVAVADEPTRGITKGDRVQNPVTTSLIFATMAIGLGTITEENASAFYARLSTYETLFGAFMYRPSDWPEGQSPNITPEEVVQHIGLRTNVSKETDSAWLKRTMARALYESAQHFKVAKRRLEEAKQEPIAVHEIA